jgi:hypothetical protein
MKTVYYPADAIRETMQGVMEYIMAERVSNGWVRTKTHSAFSNFSDSDNRRVVAGISRFPIPTPSWMRVKGKDVVYKVTVSSIILCDGGAAENRHLLSFSVEMSEEPEYRFDDTGVFLKYILGELAKELRLDGIIEELPGIFVADKVFDRNRLNGQGLKTLSVVRPGAELHA